MSDVQFSPQRLEEIAALVTRYPKAQSAILPVLHMAMEDFGHLSMPTQQLVADTLGVRLMLIREVVTFYTMYREKPCGKNLLEVCTNAGCMLNGADDLLKSLCEKLGVRPGETTKDGVFTVAEVECLGACGGAPIVQVNGDYHEKVTEKHLDDVIAKGRTHDPI